MFELLLIRLGENACQALLYIIKVTMYTVSALKTTAVDILLT